jgi:hypothetical protein
MLRINKADQEAIREKIREGRIEGARIPLELPWALGIDAKIKVKTR